MKIILSFLLMSTLAFAQQTSQQVLQLSYDFFDAVEQQTDEATALREKIGQIPLTELSDALEDDKDRLTFWINIYNANIQYILQRDPQLYEDRGAFFRKNQIPVAGVLVSFDKLEHGFLRRSKTKWSLGYIGKLFPPKMEKALRVNRVDERIHFALNCGAKSCPKIFAYKADKIDQQLDRSSKEYLQKYHKVTEDKLYVPVLMSWFRADFGGKRGVRKFVLKYQIVSNEEAKRTIDFLDYDWTLDLDSYQQ